MGTNDRQRDVIEEEIEHPQEGCHRELGQSCSIRDIYKDSKEVVGEDDVWLDESMQGSDHDLRTYHKPDSLDSPWRSDNGQHDRLARGDETI